jgi:hypothetical protein
MDKNQPDMIIKKKGRAILIRHGEEKPMDLVMTLANGARVDMDGTVTFPDGTTRMLSDGEAITLDGEPTTAVDKGAKDKMDD